MAAFSSGSEKKLWWRSRARTEPLDQLHPGLDLRLIAGPAHARGQNRGAVVACQLQVSGIGLRLVAAGPSDRALEIVRDQPRRHGAKILEGADVGSDPVGQRLGPGGLGVGVVGRPEGSDEHLRFAYLARCVESTTGTVCPA